MKNSIFIEEEMQRSYLEYSLSVIIGRAIPDVRDGLKPVHRRILYAMHDLGNTYNRAYKKSARIVGDVIGKYHPHGDSAVYDAMVRMAQDFSMRQPLVDGQGNFGSIDGDAPAAMRYTEVRMARLTSEFLQDIDKQTVPFRPNYDNTLQEPEVLPTKVPNLLLNGSSGIAVGMATNIPPHNLGELIDGLLLLLNNQNVEVADLLECIKGPDFPTGGFIYGRHGIIDAYKTGRGSIKIRGKIEVEERSKQAESIVITEIPYALNKSSLVEKIAYIIHEKKVEGVSDLRDESDRNGIRIVLDLKKNAIPEVVINALYKFTPLETWFGFNMLAVVHNRPQLLSLKEILELFIEHRKEVVLNRTRFDLNKAEQRAHILEGLKIALENIDEVIELIKSSKTPLEAKEKLIERFGFTDVQSQAILDMRLQRLTNLERDKLLAEYQELIKRIEYLKSILQNVDVLIQVIREEMTEIKKLYATPRKSIIVEEDPSSINMEDLIGDTEVVVTLSQRGYIKRTPMDIYQQQKRGGKGIYGASTVSEDIISQVFTTTNHNYILLFTNKGRMYQIKAYNIPEGSRTARGIHASNLLPLDKDESIATVMTIKDFSTDRDFLFATKKGIVKRSQAQLYVNCRQSGLKAVNLNSDDELITVREISAQAEVLLVTKHGKSIRFSSSEIRPTGRATAGVKGIVLSHSDQVVSCVVTDDDQRHEVLTVSSNGYGKRTLLENYRSQSRGGKGVINMRVTPRTGHVVGSVLVQPEDELLILTSAGKIIRMNVAGISRVGRDAQGVTLVRMDADMMVVGFDRIDEKELLENGSD
ncbi:DNA gyrase subunit A [Desulfonatronum thiosulfatophilum]|uniref:DNA gyrase subunit A n=1 Tax=Desulfonatronum thiosulfatophilum TaxID=617002 RepID=A0A1G6BYZ7_9BACT|nr:DNA gyrase subunit A [Desulfonatronum thiosulfatophilum]SDB25788.1 DNA gyrase subunit A [Desulfonatronum thiosulfatophilum]